MKRRAVLVLATLGAAIAAASPGQAQMEVQISPRPVDPNATPDSPFNPRRSLLYPREVAPDPIRPDPGGPAPTEAPRRAPARPPPLAGPGYVMTLVLGQDSDSQNSGASLAGALKRPRDVGERLLQCWRPPAATIQQEITVRLAFSGGGRVIGVPRVTYVEPATPPGRRQALQRSMLEAIEACQPLRFTPGLASAIAGRPFAIRFIAPP